MTKTAAAFTLTAEALSEGGHRRVYFWTFTFISVPINDEYANDDWNTFHNRLKWYFPRLRGLRVTELHRSHGIHYHALVNMRIPIERVKRIARGSGNLVGWGRGLHNARYLDFGRMSVSKCDEDTIMYLCKYLGKQYSGDNRLYAGRRWGTIGGFKHVSCRDVQYDSLNHRNRRWLFGDSQCSYGTLLMCQHYTNIWGEVQEWPAAARALVWRQRTVKGGEWMHEYFGTNTRLARIKSLGQRQAKFDTDVYESLMDWERKFDSDHVGENAPYFHESSETEPW